MRTHGFPWKVTLNTTEFLDSCSVSRKSISDGVTVLSVGMAGMPSMGIDGAVGSDTESRDFFW